MRFTANVPLRFELLDGSVVDVSPNQLIPARFKGQETALPALQSARQIVSAGVLAEEAEMPRNTKKGRALA